MANIEKPTDLNLVWASAGDILDPGTAKYQTGWQVEIPPRQWENFIQNKQDQAIAHINQHGVAVWDSLTEYQASKSYVQGETTGAVYRCKVTNVAQNPEIDVTNTYWELAFASPGNFYTKTVADSTFMAKAQNLSDLTNTATARTNLSVYAKSETYTKSEVDAKTTVASTAQAQSLTSNTTLLTPLRLAEAFAGAHALTAINGYQDLPSGIILQWGHVTTGTAGVDVTFTFPKPFPNSALIALVTPNQSGATGSVSITSAIIGSTTSLTFRSTLTQNHIVFVVGY